MGTTLVERFENGKLPAGWRAVAGSWRVEDGGLLVDALGVDGLITFGDPGWQNYEIEASVALLEVENDSRWVSLVFRAAPDGAKPWSQFPVRQRTSLRNGVEFAVRLEDGWSVRQRGPAMPDWELGQSRRLRVVVRGTVVQGYLDGRLAIGSPFCVDRTHGCVGLAASGCRAKFDEVAVRRLPDSELPPIEPRPCEIVAHRGFSAVAPENTLAAIRMAVEAGANACEFDVYASKDGTVVLLHDATVDRTTDGTGKVTELTVAELKRLDAGSWKGSDYAGEPVPTLAEALDLLKDSGCQAVIEIKMEGIADKVIEAVRQAGMLDQASVIAFSQDVVMDVRRLEPDLPCGWLYGKQLTGTPQERAAWIASEAARCGTRLVDLGYGLLSPEVVAELKRHGLTVWTWTVNEAAIMEALSAWGVDSITTDRPDLAVQALPRVTAGP